MRQRVTVLNNMKISSYHRFSCLFTITKPNYDAVFQLEQFFFFEIKSIMLGVFLNSMDEL